MSSSRRLDSESSEVDSSHSSDIRSKGTRRERFRVGVCLLRIYGENDPRARCYVSVDPSRRVRWLEQRLRQLLALTESFVLRSRKHLLPSAERLSILCPNDPVEVFPINTDETINVKPGKNSDLLCGAKDNSSFDITDAGKSVNEAGLEFDSSSHYDKALPQENNESIQENENETDLESYKERALAMLDNTFSQKTQCDKEDNIWIMEDYSNVNNQRTKRKRVRRRRKNIPIESNGNAWENTSASGRAPRLVHALPDEFTL